MSFICSSILEGIGLAAQSGMFDYLIEKVSNRSLMLEFVVPRSPKIEDAAHFICYIFSTIFAASSHG